MADPHAPIVGIIAGAAISPAAIVLGAQVDALIVGLIAAVFVSTWLESIDSRIKAAAAVLFSAMLAGYGSPVAASIIAASVPAAATSSDSLRLLLALVIGGCTPGLVPIARTLAIRWMGSKIPGGQP